MDWDEIDWDELEDDEVIPRVDARLQESLDADSLDEIVELIAEIAQGWSDDGTLQTRLTATRQLVTILHRQIELSEAGDCDELTACDPLYELADDVRLGPVAQEAFAALLRALEAPACGYSAADLLSAMFDAAPAPPLAAKLAEAAARAEDDALSLAILAARGNPEHAPALLALLEADDDIPWTDESVIAAVIALGGLAAPIIARLAEAAPLGGEYEADHYQVLGEPLLPHLEGREEAWIVALVARIQAPWEDMPRTFRALTQLLSRAPSLWPDFTELLRDEPALLSPESAEAHSVLCAAAHAGCAAPEALLPVLVEIGIAHEAWRPLLALGEAALPAVTAALAEDAREERVSVRLRQIEAMLREGGASAPH